MPLRINRRFTAITNLVTITQQGMSGSISSEMECMHGIQ